MKVPFMDLKRIHAPIQNELTNAMHEVLDKGDFILGEKVGQFENEFASYCDAKFAIGVASGTDALHLILKALEINSGDEVITVVNTFIATTLAVTYTGAKPVIVDADPDTYSIDISKLEKAITKKTKVLLPVHLFGNPADMNRINEIAKKHNLTVVEDACQAHGAKYNGKRVGTFGAASAFSFYPGKNLGAFGDGGMIVTNSKEIYEKVKMLRNYGSVKKYEHDIIGYNSRLDTIQAAILSIKLQHLDKWNKMRNEAADLYTKLLKDSAYKTFTATPGAEHVYHLYVIRAKSRDRLQKYLSENGVGTVIHYPIPIHQMKAYASQKYNTQDFPIVNEYSQEIVSLPMFPGITEEEIKYVVKLLLEFK